MKYDGIINNKILAGLQGLKKYSKVKNCKN